MSCVCMCMKHEDSAVETILHLATSPNIVRNGPQHFVRTGIAIKLLLD